jgi:hypothetical protein
MQNCTNALLSNKQLNHEERCRLPFLPFSFRMWQLFLCALFPSFWSDEMQSHVCYLTSSRADSCVCSWVTCVFISVFCKWFLNKLATFTCWCACLWPQASREVVPLSAFLRTSWNWRGADVTSLFYVEMRRSKNELLERKKISSVTEGKIFQYKREVETTARRAAKYLPVKWSGDWGTNRNGSAGTFYFHNHVLNDPGAYSISYLMDTGRGGEREYRAGEMWSYVELYLYRTSPYS